MFLHILAEFRKKKYHEIVFRRMAYCAFSSLKTQEDVMFFHIRIVEVIVVTAVLLSGCTDVMPKPVVSESEIGVIALAHGSGDEWNKAVFDAFVKSDGAYKRELVFGMGNARDIQKSIDRLETAGVRAIVVVPLFLSSHSEMYRHLEYILGVREEPDVLFLFLMDGRNAADGGKHGNHGSSEALLERVRFSVPYRVASPIGFNSIIAEIFVDRLRETAPETSVFFLSHGPITAEDNAKWLADLSRYEQYLLGKFSQPRFFGMTWRDDAPSFIRDTAIRKIQEAVLREIAAGQQVVIFPFLLAPGGREAEIAAMLLDCGACRIIPNTILPHPLIARYIEEKIKQERAHFAFPR